MAPAVTFSTVIKAETYKTMDKVRLYGVFLIYLPICVVKHAVMNYVCMLCFNIILLPLKGRTQSIDSVFNS